MQRRKFIGSVIGLAADHYGFEEHIVWVVHPLGDVWARAGFPEVLMGTIYSVGGASFGTSVDISANRIGTNLDRERDEIMTRIAGWLCNHKYFQFGDDQDQRHGDYLRSQLV